MFVFIDLKEGQRGRERRKERFCHPLVHSKAQGCVTAKPELGNFLASMLVSRNPRSWAITRCLSDE